MRGTRNLPLAPPPCPPHPPPPQTSNPQRATESGQGEYWISRMSWGRDADTHGLPRGTGLAQHLPKGSGMLLWVQVSAARPCPTEQLSPRLPFTNLYLTTLTRGPGALILVVPGSGRSPGAGNGNPLQYSRLENSMNRGAWWPTIHGVTKESDTTEHKRNI